MKHTSLILCLEFFCWKGVLWYRTATSHFISGTAPYSARGTARHVLSWCDWVVRWLASRKSGSVIKFGVYTSMTMEIHPSWIKVWHCNLGSLGFLQDFLALKIVEVYSQWWSRVKLQVSFSLFKVMSLGFLLWMWSNFWTYVGLGILYVWRYVCRLGDASSQFDR